MHGRSTRELRTRMAESIEAADRLVPPPPSSSASMVVITVTVSSYPTGTGKYVAVKQVDVGGAETEGGAGTFDTVGDPFYVAVVSGTIPAVGTKLVVDSVSGRWTVVI